MSPTSGSRFRLTVKSYVAVLAAFVSAAAMTVGSIYHNEWVQFAAIIAMGISLTIGVRAELQLRKSQEPVTIRERKVALVSMVFGSLFIVIFVLVMAFLAKTHLASLTLIGVAIFFCGFPIVRDSAVETRESSSARRKDLV